jgi:uncharacterized SAM-binding protein YcdF (DUF218 family)
MARRPRIVLALALSLAALGLTALIFGFVEFTDAVAARRPDPAAKADGIVAPTGGTQRIEDAVRLLIEGRGRRLLISGVNLAVTEKDIAKALPQASPLLECCIDLDHRALNTAGNAEETAKWASRNGFSSLLVVTSDYHLPRTMLELSREAPHIRLIGYPVRSLAFTQGRWWMNGTILRLLVSEYSKYVLARLYLRLDRSLGRPPTTR